METGKTPLILVLGVFLVRDKSLSPDNYHRLEG